MSEEINAYPSIKKEIANDIIEEVNSQEVERMHSFDVDPNKENEIQSHKKEQKSSKKKIQISFENVIIKTIPKEKKFCKGRNYKPQVEKTIIDNISGTIMPGQFLAILGASGTYEYLSI